MYSAQKKSNVGLQFVAMMILLFCCAFVLFTTSNIDQYVEQGWSFFTIFQPYQLFYKLLTFLVLCFNALSVFFIMQQNKLNEQRNYRAIVIYLLLSFVFPQTINLMALLAESIFIVFIFNSLLISGQRDTISTNFSYGIFVGLLALLYPPLIVVILLIYVAYLINRHYSIRDFIMPILGVLLVCVYFFSILYIIDKQDIIASCLQSAWSLITTLNLTIPVDHFILTINFLLYVLLLIWSIVLILSKSSKMVIHKRRKTYLISFSVLLFFVIYLLYNNNLGLSMSLLLVVSTALIALTTTLAKNKWKVRTFLVLLFLFSLYINFLL